MLVNFFAAGPFLVAFGTGDQERYWKVDGNYGIIGTSDTEDASPFFVMPYDNSHHPHEFHIAYMGDNGTSRKLGAMTQKTIPRYLDADVSLFGTNSGPLRLVYHVSERSRLLLFGRVANEKGPINPTMWAQGDDMFFINCARRRMKRDGYIGMRQRRRDQWVSACFPRRGAHNEQNKFMLFRLLPMSSKSNSGPRTAVLNPFKGFDIPRTLDDQLEKYGVSTK